jgi:hypothetical protein
MEDDPSIPLLPPFVFFFLPYPIGDATLTLQQQDNTVAEEEVSLPSSFLRCCWPHTTVPTIFFFLSSFSYSTFLLTSACPPLLPRFFFFSRWVRMVKKWEYKCFVEPCRALELEPISGSSFVSHSSQAVDSRVNRSPLFLDFIFYSYTTDYGYTSNFNTNIVKFFTHRPTT